jgi:triacylglycerol lipase
VRTASAPRVSANPVLLIHGIDDTEVLFARMRPYLERHGRAAHCVNLTPNDGASGLEELACQVLSYANTNFDQETAIDLVGFSMGGLVARYYVQRLGGVDRVRRLVTISSPHRGTQTAFLRRNNKGVRQMRPGSCFLSDLNRDVHTLDRVAFTSIWTPFDLMILPANSSVLPVGRTIRVNVAAHPLMARDRRVLRVVLDALSCDESTALS